MKRILITIGVLLGLQVLLTATWILVERRRARKHSINASRDIPLSQGHSTSSRNPHPTGVSVSRDVPLSRPAPNFRYQLADGSMKHLIQLKGQPVIVHFWATWCPPCRKELPALLSFARQHKVALLAVSFDDSWKDIRGFLKDTSPEFIVLAQRTAELQKSYAIDRFPVTYIIDRNGRLRARFDGARDWRSASFLQSVWAAMK